MVSQSELYERVANLLSGDLSLDDFEDWFTVASWNAHQDSSESAQKLVGAIELRLDEHSAGHLGDEELWRELYALIRTEPMQVSLSMNLNIPVSVSIDLNVGYASPTNRSRSQNVTRRVEYCLVP